MRIPWQSASFAALVFCLTVPASAQESSTSQLEQQVVTGIASREERIDLARRYVASGRFYEATKVAEAILADNPGDVEAAKLRNEAAEGLREVQDRKLREAEELAARAGASVEDRLALANAYFEGGRYIAAAETYASLPSSAMTRETRLRHARSLAWSGRTDPAEAIYVELLREDPDPALQLEYGRVLSWMGASRPALEQLTKTYESSRSEESLIALANARSWSGDRQGAIALLDEYLLSHPSAAAVQTLRDEISTSPQTRIERVDRLIELEPFNLALRVERARLLIEVGRYGAAIRELEFVEERSPRKIDGIAELKARARELRKEQLASLETRRRDLDSRKAETAEEILTLAKAYVGLEEYDRAIDLYSDYLRLRPDDTEARIQYARVLGWDRRYEASQRQYRQLLNSHPDRADLQLEYAQILSYDNEYVRAVRSFNDLTDLSGNPRAHLYPEVPPKAHFSLGQIYRWFGWNEHAVSAQNDAIALDATYEPARRELDIVRHLRPATLFDATYTFAENSNDFRLTRIDLGAQKWTSQRTAVEAFVGRHTFERGNDSVDANVFGVGARYRWSDRVTPRARVGLNFYDSDAGTRPFWALGADIRPSLQSFGAVEYNHYDLVYDVFTVESLGEAPFVRDDPVSIDDFRGMYSYNTGGHWSWLGDLSYGFLSDDNDRRGAHGLLTYRVLKSPFVAVKLDGRYLSYDFRSNRYWSPDDYRSIAGVLHLGDNIRERLFWQAELKYGKSFEGDRESDIRAIEGKLTVPINDALDLVGAYGYGKSGRLDSVLGGDDELVNYWQRRWYVGIRVKRLFRDEERRGPTPYYFEEREGSRNLPPIGEPR